MVLASVRIIARHNICRGKESLCFSIEYLLYKISTRIQEISRIKSIFSFVKNKFVREI